MKNIAIIAIIALIGCKTMEGPLPAVASTDGVTAGSGPSIQVAQAAAKGKLADLLVHAEEQYFDSNEALYGEYLAAALATGKLSEADAEKAEWILDYYIRKNAPGNIAADFRFATPEQSECTLHTYLPGDTITMILYDPDCAHCAEVIKELKGVHGHVLAVCVESTPQRWEQTRTALPQGWIKAYDRTGVLEQDLYSVRALPAIYLLDGERKVLLKNPTPAKLL